MGPVAACMMDVAAFPAPVITAAVVGLLAMAVTVDAAVLAA